MVEGLEVVIKYHGKKYDQVACPKSASSEFAILKKDLDYLRVHSPSQKNVLRVDGSFVLHWPNASLSHKTSNDSLYTRWFKMCSEDTEALRLRKFLSIESITMKQDGILMQSTPRVVVPPKDLPLEILVGKSDHPLVKIGPAIATTPGDASPMEPPPPPPPPVAYLPTAPRTDRQQLPHLKRRKNTLDGPSNQTRQKLDAPGPDFRPINIQLQPTSPTTQPATANAESSSAEAESMEISPPRELGEVTPRPTPRSARCASSGPQSVSLSGARPPPPRSVLLRYTSSSSSSGSGSHHSRHSPHVLHPQKLQQDASRQREHDVNRLMRELWDTRRQLAAMRAREQAILNDIELLGVQVPGAEFEFEVGAESAGAGGAGDQNWNGSGVSREDLQALEAELREETERRVRAERALGDVERECRAPFVVPALFHAFMSISELSS